MKKILTIISVACIASAVLVACNKQTETKAPYTEAGMESSFLKINYVSSYTLNPSVHLKVNNNRVSNLLTPRTPYPGGGFNTGGGSSNDYMVLRPGSNVVSVAVPFFNTNRDSLLLASTSVNLKAGRNYSLHITDTLGSATGTKYLLVEDDMTAPISTNVKFKFINLMPNVPFADLYYGNNLVASNVPYLGVSSNFELPVSGTSITWSVRETGTAPTSTALATIATTSPTAARLRVMTVFANGYKGQTATSVRRPFVAFYINR
jgi:hypothetical protein